MDKYCCFFHPIKDYSIKALDDLCPSCGRKYRHPLEYKPEKIRDLRVVASLGRGFYGAAYLVKRGKFDTPYVLKISPVKFYRYFKKTPFETEVENHANLAKHSTHVVGISDYFNSTVRFSDPDHSALRCHVTVLDFVEGYLLQDYLTGKRAISASRICQLAVDLLRIREELELNRVAHNDLHAENLIVEELHDRVRKNQIDGSIMLRVIDLGSLADNSLSDDQRLGDLEFITNHITALLAQLIQHPASMSDREYRVALALEGIVQQLKSDVLGLRIPGADEFEEQVRAAYYRATLPWRPWRTSLHLRTFSDHYNAQTLESWNVPSLLVDPEHRWIKEVTKPGPQIITGMRGCGKTMLLRSLDVHARAAQRQGESPSDIVSRLRSDHFVGLFASALKLLDLREQSLLPLEHRLTRLFFAYALEACRALIHIKDIDDSLIAPGAHLKLASAVSSYANTAEELKRSASLDDLERQLLQMMVQVTRGDTTYVVKQAPAEVFAHLATEFRGCSELLTNSSVYFLLDDVSTRYLELEKIETLLSALLFQSPVCAFKFTSEWQTIELGLQSPGRIHPIRVDRDVDVFDLGADVLTIINAKGNRGKEFVCQVLQQRANIDPAHPAVRDPELLLGDVPLSSIAWELATASETSNQKKHTYRGLSCLTNVCVGDIGDVIKLYGEILKMAGSHTALPIKADVQSDCFQNICSLRLYDLSRRANYYKSHALGFAQASRELLVRSARTSTADELESRHSIRLRQFSSIYVRITSDDPNEKEKQIRDLRDLIDAGVFVFSGGNARSKTKDSNPLQQFTLAYRKIYGITAGIGLADRDRFELSGDQLKSWLGEPQRAKDILLRNQVSDEILSLNTEDFDMKEEIPPTSPTSGIPKSPTAQQLDLVIRDVPSPRWTAPKTPEAEIRELSPDELSTLNISAVVSSLGFEERTLYSNRVLSENLRPQFVHLVRYPLPGYAANIVEAWERSAGSISEASSSSVTIPDFEGLILVDTSGLTKPWIFSAIRSELLKKHRVVVCHTSAITYYPLPEDLEVLFESEASSEPLRFLESLASVLMGEKGPYKEMKLLEEEGGDPSRGRGLIAFASSKHERLFTLLDVREFDRIRVIVPASQSPRSRVASYAAEILSQNYSSATIAQFDSHNVSNLFQALDREYLEMYERNGLNVEIGLTGSKTQAIAAAMLAATRKLAQAWYVKPAVFDEKRFTKGVGNLRLYEIQLQSHNAR